MRNARWAGALAALALAAVPTAAMARFGDRPLRLGATGHDVRVLQSWLGHLGFVTAIDGAFGRGTRSSLRRWERSSDLTVDGVLSRWDARRMRAVIERRFGGADDPRAVPGVRARLSRDGRTALVPASAPRRVRDAIAAANRITRKPYRYGGGHGRFEDSGYDCSGTVSYALRGAGLLGRPLDSTGLMRWGRPGRGRWITVYSHGGHAYVVIAGLRFDTSGRGEEGPRWRPERTSTRGYRVRHWPGL